MKKDQQEIDLHKQKIIEELKKIDKQKFFEPKPKNKVSIFKKILIIFGYGKKG